MSVPPYEVAATITRKKLLYCRYADTKKWHLMPEVALPDCTYEYTSNGEAIVIDGFQTKWDSTEAFTQFISKSNENLQHIHLIGPGELVRLSDDAVEAVFPLIYHSKLKKGAVESVGVQGTGGGHYYETWVRKGDDWFIKTLVMDRIYEDDK